MTTVRLVADRDAFAAERRRILGDADERIAPAVREALGQWGADGWHEPIVTAALAVWDDVFESEYPEGSPVRDEMRAAFRQALVESLDKTSAPGEDPEVQVARITNWLSAYAVNSATAAAAAADTETDLTLEWVSMEDEAVRASHRAADGQTVPIGGTFEVDGYDLHFPGEPVGPPSVWINCRCVARIGPGGDMSATTTTAGGSTITLTLGNVTLDDAHLAALTAAAESEETDEDAPDLPEDFDMGPVPWHGVLTVEGIQTGDRRKFTAGALEWVDLPTNLRWQKEDQPGHDGSVIVGRIDEVWRDETSGEIRASGIFHDSEEAIAAMDLIGQGMLRGVSVDVDSAEVELQTEDGGAFDWDEENPESRPVEVITAGRIRSAALCSIAAFAEAFVALGPWGESPIPEEEITDAQVASGEFAPGTRDGPGWITHPQATQRITNYWVKGEGAAKIGWGTPNDFYRCRRQLAKYVQNPEWLSGLCANLHKRALGIWPGEHTAKGTVETGGDLANFECTDCLESLVAGGWAPPSEWFLDPDLPGPTPITVSDDGRVYGHVATWGTCHIGQPGACVTPPHSATDYAYFHVKPCTTASGEEFPVGTLTVDTGHAPLRNKALAAMAHYDNSGHAAAFVRAGEDAHGIWVAGVVNPNATEEQVFALKMSALSGDWREIGGSLEMVAALAVNVPGFPIPRTALAASGTRQTALVASGLVVRSESGTTEASLDEVVRATVRQMLAQVQEQTERRARAEAARAQIKAARVEMARARLGV